MTAPIERDTQTDGISVLSAQHYVRVELTGAPGQRLLAVLARSLV